MARGGEGDIPSNDLGQGITSSSGCTHLQGASGAPIGCRRGAADCPRSIQRTSLCTLRRVLRAVFCGGGTQHIPLSAAAKARAKNASEGPENVLRMLATTVGSTPDNEAMAHVRTYAYCMAPYVIHCCSHG